VGDDARVDAIAEAADVGVTHFLDQHHFVLEVTATAPVLLRNRGAQNARLTGFGPRFAINNALLLPALGMGNKFSVEKFAYGISHDVQFFIHPWRYIAFKHCVILFFYSKRSVKRIPSGFAYDTEFMRSIIIAFAVPPPSQIAIRP